MLKVVRVFRSPVPLYRFARALHRWKVPVAPLLVDYFVRFFFSCWLPHTAQIGRDFELGYGGLGCVIHTNAVIGRDVHVGTNVTIGGNARVAGAPRIGNNVYIGGGSQVLGPITIGDGSVIGANSVVVRDVAPRTVVAGNPARVIHEDIDINEYLFHLRHDGKSN